MILAKIWIQGFLMNPSNIDGFITTKKQKQVLKLIGSILYYIFRDAILGK